MKHTLDQLLTTLIRDTQLSSQKDLQTALAAKGLHVNQSTISRALLRINAIKAKLIDGRTAYKIARGNQLEAPASVKELVKDIRGNGYLIVVSTILGTANTVAVFLDQNTPSSVLATLAGEDTIFIAPHDINSYADALNDIRQLLLGEMEV